MDHRRHRVVWGVNGTRSVTSEDYWKQPLKWNREAEQSGVRKRVFCASLADVFEDWDGEVFGADGAAHFTSDSDPSKVATNQQMMGTDSGGYHYTTLNDCRERLFKLIDKTPFLDWQLLTKRPQNIEKMWPLLSVCPQCTTRLVDDGTDQWRWCSSCAEGFPQYGLRSNIWLGTSISDQDTADRNIQILAKSRELSPVLFVSAEPLVSEVDLSSHLSSLDWVIVGGESGPEARLFCIEWAESIVNQCHSTAVFVKQLGSHACSSKTYSLNLKDRKGGDMNEWPGPIRVRKFPTTVTV